MEGKTISAACSVAVTTGVEASALHEKRVRSQLRKSSEGNNKRTKQADRSSLCQPAVGTVAAWEPESKHLVCAALEAWMPCSTAAAPGAEASNLSRASTSPRGRGSQVYANTLRRVVIPLEEVGIWIASSWCPKAVRMRVAPSTSTCTSFPLAILICASSTMERARDASILFHTKHPIVTLGRTRVVNRKASTHAGYGGKEKKLGKGLHARDGMSLIPCFHSHVLRHSPTGYPKS